MQTHHIPENWRIEKTKQGIAVWDENGVPRCGVLCRSGKPCMKAPNRGVLRCRMHGGNARTGEAHQNFVHGKQSRYAAQLPARLRDRYAKLLESENIGDLSENVSLLDLRLQELLNRVDIGEFGASYNSLRSIHTRANRAMDIAFNGTDPDARKEALAAFVGMFHEMGDLIAIGQKDYQTWREILDVNAERRQTVKTMADIEHKGENAVPVSEVWALLMNWKDLFERVNRLQTEEERRREMAQGLSKLVNFKAG